MSDPSVYDPEPVDYIAQTRQTYSRLGYEPYRWATHGRSVELARREKPLSLCRVALVASGGIYRVGQVAFHHRDDTSHRKIPGNTNTDDLRISHFAYDTTAARRDPNVVFPIEVLRRLASDGTIGSLAPDALSFMGGIYSQRRVKEELIPALAADLAAMAADVVLLVPV